MSNPFEKRATEYLQDDTAFLSIVAPEPLDTYFKAPATAEVLYDRLCVVIGTPGSGKTTIAKLLEFKTLHTLLNSPNINDRLNIEKALSDCGAIEHGAIKILGCRLPIGSEYRQFFELPYEPEVSFGLLMSFIQARAVISWINFLEKYVKVDRDKISIVSTIDGDAAIEMIGGSEAFSVYERAAEVEKAIYSICAALVPPALENLSERAVLPYKPFQTIEALRYSDESVEHSLKPLVMLDDVHFLHPEQLLKMQEWLSNREIKIPRWLLMRIDGQTPNSVLGQMSEGVTSPTIKESREVTKIWLQSGMGADRLQKRKDFRRMAKSMSSKYLRLIPIIQEAGITTLQEILNTNPTEISGSKLGELKEQVEVFLRKNSIVNTVRKQFEKDIDNYDAKQKIRLMPDERLAVLLILLNRYVKRVPQEQLFGEGSLDTLSKPITVNSGVVEGARIHLLNKFNRPYYFGMDNLCDVSSENAEQFLQLAGRMVAASETQLLRKQPLSLSSERQHKLLIEKANEAIDQWVFPYNAEVKKLCDLIGIQCNQKSIEPNAPLNGGANAFGLLDQEFDHISESDKNLAVVLKYAIAYGAITIKRKHSTKNVLWTLIELSGPMIIKHRLTPKRGGFLERRVEDLSNALSGES